MSLPPFLTRIHNATGPLLEGIAESELGDRLSTVTLRLQIDQELAADPGQHAGFLLAVNLGARLYPRLQVEAPGELREEADRLALSINPNCELNTEGSRELGISWGGGDKPEADRVTIAVRDWNLGLDGAGPEPGSAVAPAAMAAAALGIGELFRSLFADRLVHGRDQPSPFALNLLTLGAPEETPSLPKRIPIGVVHLAGCGAIGQAAVATLRELPVEGTLVAVDHDLLDEGNLQRYVLGGNQDIGLPKPSLVARALANHRLAVEEVLSRWGLDSRSGPGQDTVLAALDTRQGRIELAAGLHRRVMNAWTQPEDLGVSRHEAFGVEPCLACLAWPHHRRLSESARIAQALGESELRVLRYLLGSVPVGEPLRPEHLQGTVRLPLPADADLWLERSLLADLGQRYEIPREELEPLRSLGVAGLYRDAVCAGLLIERRESDQPDEDVSVPLAHQSALAGILLATWLVIDRTPALATIRPQAAQARYDVLRGGEQIWPRKRGREPHCICSDADFLAAYASRWGRQQT